jgi:hypothetical protein
LNTVVTNSITVLVSGTAASGDIIRIMGIRGNIAGANLPPNTSVNGTIIAIPPNAFQIDNVTTFPVAFVLDEIKVTVHEANPILACETQCETGSIVVQEKFPSALTTVTDENDIQHKPSSAAAKRATNGTQLTLSFAGIPPGVKVTVPAGPVIGTGGLSFTLVTSSNTFTNTSTTTPASTSFTYATASDDINISESVSFTVQFCPTSGIPAPPVLSTVTAQVTLGPNITPISQFVSTVPSTSILSFVANPLNTPPDNIAELANCVTNLLCKFISTATGAVPGGGYDTGLAIANTSLDIFGDDGANPQAGVCRMFLFGSGGSNANINSTTKPVFTTPLVAAGTSAVFDAKFTAGVGAGFQGYSIIQCDFQFGHAEAIIADQQFSTFSHGYDCLILPDTNVVPRSASPFSANGFGAGEGLFQKRAK